ncbi:MAG: hypothetical protein PUC11_05670 [Elusimicrobia bacterium]|nr:hypothetical protein [Elusimicrobiota bacterium]
MSNNNTPNNEPQNHQASDSGLAGSDTSNQQKTNESNNNFDRILFKPIPPSNVKKQESSKLQYKFEELENSIFERLSYNLSKLEKKIDELDKEKTALEDKITATEKKNQEFTRALRKAEHAVRKMSREVKVTERKSLEFLGIFITLFTFISVSASTVLQFKNVHHSIFFLASFCFCLLLFLHLFHLVLRNEKIGKKCWIIFYSIVLLSCGGGAVLCYHHGNKTKDTMNEKNSAIQINYTQTNGYEQTISPLVQPNPTASN